MPRIRQVTTISFPAASRSRPTRLAIALASLLAALALASPALASAYESPFLGDSPIIGRTDMGVDVCLSPGDPIRAIGTGTVAGIMPNWYAGQPYIWYQLTGGPQTGQYVYVAEQIDHLARVGQSLRAGDVIARYARAGSCLETGWSMADGETRAQAGTGYTDGQVTTAGTSFARFLLTLGVAGQFELSAPQTQSNRATTSRRHRKHRTTPTPAPKPAPTPKPTTPSATPTPGPGSYPGPNFGPGTEPYWAAPH